MTNKTYLLPLINVVACTLKIKIIRWPYRSMLSIMIIIEAVTLADALGVMISNGLLTH